MGPAATEPPAFSDETVAFGLTTGHRQGDERLTGLDETLGAGACAFDYDNDGWVDLFIVNGAGDTRYYGRKHWWQSTGGHRLLKNANGERFADVTRQAGIQVVTNGMGCVAADFDNDGNTDLLITSVGANTLLRNNGDGTFTDVTDASGLADNGWHTAAAVADVDGDGLLDVYVGGFISFEKGARTFEPGSQFKQDQSPLFNSALYPALPNHLYRNRGGFKFEDVTEIAGVADGDGRTLAALWVDVNDDGRPDLIVANAAGTGSTTGYTNAGDWHFERLGIQSRIDSGLSFRGIGLGDLDNDGRAELVLTGAAGNQTALLFRNENSASDGANFIDQARQWQLANEKYAAFSPWSPILGDFNNDGWTDLFIGNGQLTPDPDSPHVTVGQPEQLWLNGSGALHEFHPAPLSPLLDHQSARGAVLADFNNDGRLDLYVVRNNDLGQLLINSTKGTNHWLGVKLLDTADAVGARVSATTNDGTQVKWVVKGMGFLSDQDARLHFGLGGATQTTLAVTWRSGSRSVYRDVPADAYVEISRANGLVRRPANPPASTPPATDSSVLARPDARAELLSALARVPDAPGVRRALQQSVHDPDAHVRAAVIAAIGAEQTSDRLTLLIEFLGDDADTNVAAAVDAVCAYEEEFATRFLLRMLAHPAATVRRHAVECFTRYYAGFQAQQAVIHRKYLAVPYLAGLLEDPDKEVRIATARALGAAEKFRGVDPLIEMAKDPDPLQQQEAVRALGLIRDKYAVPALQRLMADPTLAPATYAQIFIALKRLNDPSLDSLLTDFAAGRAQFAQISAATRLTTLLAMFDATDNVVFAKKAVVQWARTAYAGTKRSNETDLLYARILERGGADSPIAALRPLQSSTDARVRLAAYLAAFTLQPAERQQLVRAALQDSDPAVRSGILERLSTERVALPDALFVGVLQDTATRLAALAALRSGDSAAVRHTLVGWVEDAKEPTDVRIAALGALGRFKSAAKVSEQLHGNVDDDLQIAMLNFECGQLPAIFVSKTAPSFVTAGTRAKSLVVRQAAVDCLVTREELWAKQALIALLQNADDPALRQYIMQTLPPNDALGGYIFIGIASNRDDLLRFDALRRLRGTTDDEAAKALRKTAADPNEDPLARVLAAAALPKAESDAALVKLIDR